MDDHFHTPTSPPHHPTDPFATITAGMTTTDWRRHLPNLLTMFRLVLAAAFFLALNLYWFKHTSAWPANIAVVLFILAAVTDALDGHLARKWQVVSVFGRIMDPLCDKVLILGAFIYLAGPRFVDEDMIEQGIRVGRTTGITPWMVVLILFRELLVTGIRSLAESSGITFSSNWWGKAKMILQTIAIPAVLVIAVNINLETQLWAVIIRDVFVWGTLAVTVISGVPYVTQFHRVMKSGGPSENASAE